MRVSKASPKVAENARDVVVVEVLVLRVKGPTERPDPRHARVVPKPGAAQLLDGTAAARAREREKAAGHDKARGERETERRERGVAEWRE
jgi:hypothetical protein